MAGLLNSKKKQSSGGLISKRLGGSFTKQDLTTSAGLEEYASQVSLEEKAKQVLAQKGETKKIFSGGFVSDIFDTLNALQYGTVGLAQGKGFMEGVKNRASWADKEYLGKHGLAGTIAGIAADIAMDPLTYVAPWTIAKKIPGVAKGVKAVSKVAEASKMGQWFGEKFIYMFGKDPVYRELWERSVKNIGVGTQNIGDMAKGVANLTPDIAKKILTKDETGRFIRTPLEKLRGVLSEDELFNVAKNYSVLDDLGKQAVDLGLLNKGKWEDNVGQYIKNAYEEYELKKGAGVFGYIKKKIAGIKPRKKGLTPEKMKELGQIDNPAYLLFKSQFDLFKDIENAKFFKGVAKTFGSDTLKDGFKQVATDKKFGELAGKFVPENLLNDLTEITKPIQRGMGEMLMGEFKKAKTIMNPATHVRNVISNQILNWWKLGIGPWRQDLYYEAIKQMKNGGKWIDEAKSVGYGLNTMQSNEIRQLIESKSGNVLGKAKNFVEEKLGNLYQNEENFAKLTAFIAKRKAGLGIEDAWKAAESATFNYAQVTPFVRKLRTSVFGYPFITFAMKAAPTAVETALTHPQRISSLGKIKTAIEQMSDIKETERERASEPQWIRDGFYIKLPIKDEHGRSAYFDLTYIIPFGDLMSGSILTPTVSKETGLPEGYATTALKKSPLFNFIAEISNNQDFYGDKIWKDSDSQEKKLGDLMRHITKTFAPPLVADQIPGGYMEATNERRKKGVAGALTEEENIKQQRTLMQELLRTMGMKIQPIDVDIQETYMEWEKKKAMETLLRESGALKEFRRSYIPK